MEDKDKILFGETLPLPETDQEDESPDSLIDSASVRYDIIDIIDSIGNDNFKYKYLSTIDSIKQQSIEYLISFSNNIIEKIKTYYDFEFSRKFDINEREDIMKLLSFVEFLEYNYLSFLATFWRLTQRNLIRSDINKVLERLNLDTMIEETLKLNPQNEMISDFLRTNTKENIYLFILDRSQKSRMEIVSKMIDEGGR